MLDVGYFYNAPLPNQLAEPIQTLNTCHALARRGVQTTIFSPKLTTSADQLLAHHGLSPTPCLTITPDLTLADTKEVLVARAESGITYFRRRPPNKLVLYEAHRVSFPFAGEWNDSAFPKVREWLTRYRERRAVRHADGYLFLNETVQADHERFFGRSQPAQLLPGGVAIPPTLPNTERDIDLIYVGKLLRRKGVHTLTAALPQLATRTVQIVGAESAELPIPTNASSVFVGYRPPRAIPALLQRAKVGCCPLPQGVSTIAERYTFPLKMLEMMANGVAIVGSDLPTLRVLLRHEENALLVPPNDPAALVAAVERLLNDEPLRQRLITAAFATVQAYSWENRAAKLHRFILEQLT